MSGAAQTARPGAPTPFDPETRDVPAWDAAVFEAHVGQEIGVSRWIEIDQRMVDGFAVATQDCNWVHVDPDRAAGSSLGGPIAHGFLTLSLLAQIGYQITPKVAGAAMVLNYGIDRCRMIAPVPVGARLRGRARLHAVRRHGDAGLRLAYDMTVELEGQEVAAGGRPALTALWLLYARLEASA